MHIHMLFFLFLFGITAFRFSIAPEFGLGVDEAHYVFYGMNPDWSYFDHPPLVGWIHASFQQYGSGELIARAPAILCGFLTSVLLYNLLLPISENRLLVFFAVFTVHTSFLIDALFLMFLPDTLLMPILLGLILVIRKIEEGGDARWWILAGILLGLAGLSKYSAILFVPPILLYLMLRWRWDILTSKKILLVIFPALFLISPVLYWNHQHDWISFAYQSDHVLGSSEINWTKFFQSFAAQFGAYSPFLFPIAVYGLLRGCFSRDPVIRLCVLIALFLLGFFIYSSLYKTVLPHWSIHFYLLFIPIGVLYLWEKRRKTLQWLVGISALIALIAHLELAYKFALFKDYTTAHRDIYGWDKIMQDAEKQIIKKNQNPASPAVGNWTLGSRAKYYYPGVHELHVLDTRFDQFDLWEQESPLGKNLLVINTHFSKLDVENKLLCDRTETLPTLHLERDGIKINDYTFTWCYNYQGRK